MAEPFSDEAMLFTKELVMQREVSRTVSAAAPFLWHPRPRSPKNQSPVLPLNSKLFCFTISHNKRQIECLHCRDPRAPANDFNKPIKLFTPI